MIFHLLIDIISFTHYKISLIVGTTSGDNSGVLYVRPSAKLFMETNYYPNASIIVANGASATLPPVLYLDSHNSRFYGEVCGWNAMVIRGTLYLSSQGKSCGVHPGNYTLSSVALLGGSKLLTENEFDVFLGSFVCIEPGSFINPPLFGYSSSEGRIH